MVPQLDLTPSPAATSGAPSLLPVYLAHAMTHLYIGLFPAVLFLLREEFAAGYATLGAAFTAAMLAYGLLALPTGFAVNRVSPLTLVRVVLVGGAAACLAIAVVPGQFGFAVALLALGVACGPYHTAGLTLISRVSGNDPRRLARHGMVGNLGLAAAPTFGALLAWLVSWRLPFAAAAMLGLAVAALTLRMRELDDPLMSRRKAATAPPDQTAIPPFPDAAASAPADPGVRQSGGAPLGDAARPSAASAPQTTPAAAARSTLAGGTTYLPALVLVYAVTVALGFIYRGFATYLPALAAERSDLLPAAAVLRGGILASVIYLAGFFGQWWGGHLGGRRHAEALYAVLLAATALLLGVTFFATDALLLVALAATSLIHFATQPMDNTFTGRYTSLTHRGLGYGVSFALSFGFGSFAAWAGGAVADAKGDRLEFVWLLLAGVAAVAAACGAALAVLARRRDQDARRCMLWNPAKGPRNGL